MGPASCDLYICRRNEVYLVLSWALVWTYVQMWPKHNILWCAYLTRHAHFLRECRPTLSHLRDIYIIICGIQAWFARVICAGFTSATCVRGMRIFFACVTFAHQTQILRTNMDVTFGHICKAPYHKQHSCHSIKGCGQYFSRSAFLLMRFVTNGIV
jgi:hypothetical protein